MEIWKEVKGYEKYYLVSNEGRVKSIRKDKMFSLVNNGNGYKRVQLTDGTTGRKYYVHRLVAEAFIPNEHGKTEVNHIDGNPSNNNVNNLEWVSSSENTKHAVYKKALKPWKNPPKPIMAIDVLTGEVKRYATISQAELEIGSRHIIDVLKGRRRICKGYTFKYIEGGDAIADFSYRSTE